MSSSLYLLSVLFAITNLLQWEGSLAASSSTEKSTEVINKAQKIGNLVLPPYVKILKRRPVPKPLNEEETQRNHAAFASLEIIHPSSINEKQTVPIKPLSLEDFHPVSSPILQLSLPPSTQRMVIKDEDSTTTTTLPIITSLPPTFKPFVDRIILQTTSTPPTSTSMPDTTTPSLPSREVVLEEYERKRAKAHIEEIEQLVIPPTAQPFYVEQAASPPVFTAINNDGNKAKINAVVSRAIMSDLMSSLRDAFLANPQLQAQAAVSPINDQLQSSQFQLIQPQQDQQSSYSSPFSFILPPGPLNTLGRLSKEDTPSSSSSSASLSHIDFPINTKIQTRQTDGTSTPGSGGSGGGLSALLRIPISFFMGMMRGAVSLGQFLWNVVSTLGNLFRPGSRQ